MPIVIAPEPDHTPVRQRVLLHALTRYIKAVRSGWPLRTAFWLGFIKTVSRDSLKS